MTDDDVDAWWEADEREYCPHCGAEIDHYLGCPNDPVSCPQPMSDKKIGYYVLWTNRAGMHVWSGPYPTISQAGNSTAMRDRLANAFVVHYAGPVTT